MSVTVSFGEDAAATLHDDQQHVGALCVQQCIRIHALCIEDVLELFLQCFLTEVFIHSFLILLVVGLHRCGGLAERGKEAEYRIHCRMVQELILREIHLSYITRRYARAAPHAYHEQRDEEQSYNGGQQTGACGFHRTDKERPTLTSSPRVAYLTDATSAFFLHRSKPHQYLVEDEGEQNDDQSAYQQIPHRHTGKGLLGC